MYDGKRSESDDRTLHNRFYRWGNFLLLLHFSDRESLSRNGYLTAVVALQIQLTEGPHTETGMAALKKTISEDRPVGLLLPCLKSRSCLHLLLIMKRS